MLKMKITMYELLGLVKDGKAPKKIKYYGKIFQLEEENGYYYCYENDFQSDWSSNLLSNELILSADELNDYVEIIEESKKIEKLDLDGYYDDNSYCECKSEWCSSEDVLVVKINEIIDEINNLKEK